jgi:membrane fusion protein, multidrug efflux system
MMVCLGLIVAGVIDGTPWYLSARHYESTDDAFIDGRPVLISPQVTGNIMQVKPSSEKRRAFSSPFVVLTPSR